MTVALRPLRADEFDAWADAHTAWYADDLERNGGMPTEAARSKSRADLAHLLGGGVESPGQHLFVVEADGRPVGSLWYGTREDAGEQAAFLYAIEIAEAERGRGHGRAAMRRFEEHAAATGHTLLRLNVFGGNERARGLYASLGWQELAVWMGKRP